MVHEMAAVVRVCVAQCLVTSCIIEGSLTCDYRLPLCTILDENGIVFEVEVSRDEALASLEFYKNTCPGLSSISSLQGVLQAMDRGQVRKQHQLSLLFL